MPLNWHICVILYLLLQNCSSFSLVRFPKRETSEIIEANSHTFVALAQYRLYRLWGCNEPIHLLILALYKLSTHLLPYLFRYLFTFLRIVPFHFQAGGHNMRPNLVLVFFVFISSCSAFCYRYIVCFCCVRFSFSVFSQDIGWKERLQNDLFSCRWDVNLKSIDEFVDASDAVCYDVIGSHSCSHCSW